MSEQPFHIVLYQPVIPQNTGAIARLCACTGAVLHLIHPLGFRTDEASVRRAGLDYWPHVDVREHADWEAFLEKEKPAEMFFFSKFSRTSFASQRYQPGTFFVFGAETTGLPEEFRPRYPGRFLQVPMRTHLVRSLNLSQCAAIVVYEALRQCDYAGIPTEG